MSSEVSNDNIGADATKAPDASGQAAMLLVESLIHGLIARDLITVVDAVEIVEIAADARCDIAAEIGDSAVELQKSLGLLKAVSDSLSHDIPHE